MSQDGLLMEKKAKVIKRYLPSMSKNIGGMGVEDAVNAQAVVVGNLIFNIMM